ncbi:MurR/RpiR family transcriptional regulator [Rhodovulum euryhalinum]|uniref:RpiR family transcriptional regulator n=1 Tax=Rhodovulum euryhalinum TaxID=35805 RepID=A0A4R2KG81_9RHOB|nr:MurR/RpiR family transcriptional regulator [Rhodovulum euryhalinum]TCO69419.1 RpiR family transcriptional regulator [Rhodovulum euryhalinum]
MRQRPAPRSVEGFHDRLLEIQEGLPKRLRQCAEYLAAHTDRIAVSTVAEIAAAAGVQPSAVMRFCQLMGFSGYSEMQKLFRDSLTAAWPDYRERLKGLRDSGAGSPSALLAEFAEAGTRSLEALVSNVDSRQLDRAVKVISEARTVHVAGLRRAFPVAAYLAYAFEKMERPAMLHSRTANLDARHAVREGDALIAITFAPYSAATVDLAEHCTARGVPVVAITDTALSPLMQLDAISLMVREVDFGAFRALSATLALATTLAVASGAKMLD